MNKQRGILIKKPISLLKRALKADYSRFMEAFIKTFAYGFVYNVESAMIEAKGMLSALGLQNECSQIAWFLVPKFHLGMTCFSFPNSIWE